MLEGGLMTVLSLNVTCTNLHTLSGEANERH